MKSPPVVREWLRWISIRLAANLQGLLDIRNHRTQLRNLLLGLGIGNLFNTDSAIATVGFRVDVWVLSLLLHWQSKVSLRPLVCGLWESFAVLKIDEAGGGEPFHNCCHALPSLFIAAMQVFAEVHEWDLKCGLGTVSTRFWAWCKQSCTLKTSCIPFLRSPCCL